MNADKGGSAAPRAMLSQAQKAHSFWHRARDYSIHLACFFTALFLSSCATPKDVQHHVVISVKDQTLALLDREKLVATYPVSTSKYGLGDWRGSYRTPLGEMEIADKIGGGMPAGTVFKDRIRTGEIVLPNAPGRDPIVSRIIWLRGREPQNANAFGRDIYIHGTPEERNLGLPVSYGCVRMSSNDVIKLYEIVGFGAQVTIVDAPLANVVPELASIKRAGVLGSRL